MENDAGKQRDSVVTQSIVKPRECASANKKIPLIRHVCFYSSVPQFCGYLHLGNKVNLAIGHESDQSFEMRYFRILLQFICWAHKIERDGVLSERNWRQFREFKRGQRQEISRRPKSNLARRISPCS